MYHQIVKRNVRRGFQLISRGDFEALLKQFAPTVHFTFAGDHALTADVRSRDAVRRWFQRVHDCFPGLQIEARRIIVKGFPWNTVVTAQFTVRATLRDGTPYENHGVQILNIVWGRIVEDYLMEDTQLLTKTLRHLRELGVTEAAAAPIA